MFALNLKELRVNLEYGLSFVAQHSPESREKRLSKLFTHF
jgi:hypothetical protein